jgi:TPR repeat protein
VAPDAGRAAALYEEACGEEDDEREMAGCFRLAELLRAGDGVTRDVERAVELFVAACYGRSAREGGSPPIPQSCFRVGDMYANGDGVERNPFRANSYLRRACSLGYDAACEDS